jgi:hypothetical protein
MLRREEVAAAVQVGAEANALVGHLAQLAQAEDLETAGISEQAAWPADESVQTAHPTNGFVAGAEIEVIGVAENDFGAKGLQDVLGDGFDGAGCADGHEDGGLNGLVGKDELRAAAAGFGLVEQVELETHSTILDGLRSMEI